MRPRIKLLVIATATILSLGSLGPARADEAVQLPIGPPLQTSPEILAKALNCPGTFRGAHEPVLLVHGTAGTSDAWSWNYVKVLSAQGYDVCAVSLPDFARADIQVSAEYVVYAIRSINERSLQKVEVIGFSQGPLEPRWAIKYWPDIAERVDDLVLLAGVSHGFTETETICSSDCIAPFWQMKPESKFLAALNSGTETPGSISYTSVYSRTDQFVWLTGGGADPWAHSASLKGATNIGIQDICPGRVVEHFGALFDAVYYAVTIDALTHPGPTDVSRIDRAVCGQVAMPGVDLAEALQKSAELHRDLYTRTGEHHIKAEPPLASYAS